MYTTVHPVRFHPERNFTLKQGLSKRSQLIPFYGKFLWLTLQWTYVLHKLWRVVVDILDVDDDCRLGASSIVTGDGVYLQTY